MKSKYSDIKFIIEYSSKMQADFKKFFIQNQFYEYIAKNQKLSFEPMTDDIDLAHDHYLKVIYNIQLLKLAFNGDLIIQAVKSKNFLFYAQGGRSLLEQVALWRYFLVNQYLPTFHKGQEITIQDSLKLIEIHKQFLHGTRFDWTKWLEKDYEGLDEAFLQYLKDKKDKKKNKDKQNVTSNPLVLQVNAQTCVEKMSEHNPRFGVYYSMFCELVHPNFGSNIFLCGMSSKGVISIDESEKIQLGMKLIEETFGELINLTYGKVSELSKDHFSMLICEPQPDFLTYDF
jgi:hypothetical protein